MVLCCFGDVVSVCLFVRCALCVRVLVCGCVDVLVFGARLGRSARLQAVLGARVGARPCRMLDAMLDACGGWERAQVRV